MNKLTPSDIYDINKKTGALILGKNRLDDYATKFLTKYCKEALETPMPLPVDKIIDKANLSVVEAHLSKDLDIFGCCLLLDSEVEIFDEEGKESNKQRFPAGTILIDPKSAEAFGEGLKRNTLIHEVLHWEKDKTYFEILAVKNKTDAETLYPIMCRCSEIFYEPPYGKKTKENEIKWLEWQAHRLAPRVLMPAKMFKQKALELVSKYMTNCEDDSYPCNHIVSELADFFIVSSLSVKYRLVEVGIVDEMTSLSDFDEVFDDLYKTDNTPGYRISLEEAFELYLSNDVFRKYIDSGCFGHRQIVIAPYLEIRSANTPNLLSFGEKYIPESCTTPKDGVMYSKEQRHSRKKTFSDTPDNREIYDRNMAFRERFLKDYERAASNAVTANERMWEFMQAAHWNTSIFQAKTHLSPMDYTRVQEPEYKFKLRAYVAMAVGLELSLTTFQEVIKLAGMCLRDGNKEDMAYSFILSTMHGQSIDDCNDFLIRIGIKRLGTHSRDESWDQNTYGE